MLANKNRIYRDVDLLTSIYPYRNYKNIASLQKAANYIESAFKQTGLTVSRQTWDAKGNTYENVIAAFQPEKKQRFIVGAHYDVYRDIPGADDNASAVAGILELGRLFSIKNPNVPYGIDLVAFCLEEPPFFKTKLMGSYIHARSVFEKGIDVIGMISIEMIGYYNPLTVTSDNNNLFVSGIRRYDTFNKKISQLIREGSTMGSRRISFDDNYVNNGPSDHRNYWKFDYPAVMVIGAGESGNPHYHKPSDTIETLDFDLLTEAVNSLKHVVSNFTES